MLWDLIKDSIIWIIGIIIAVWEIIQQAKKRKSKLPIVLWSIVIIVLGILGLDQIRRNNRDKEDLTKQLNDLSDRFDTLQKEKTSDSLASLRKVINDSIRDAEFEKKLFDEFKITRDSISNKPQATTYNTKINTAESVHIGPGK
jgi:hypothetical protein